MDMNRRQLFRFGAAAVLTAAVAPVASALSAPTLWGDGEHDDTEALQAAIDGKPVKIAGETIMIREGEFVGGIYAISRPIIVENKQGWNMKRVTLRATEEFSSDHLLEVRNVNDCIFYGLDLDHRKPSVRAAQSGGRWMTGIKLAPTAPSA